MGDVRISHNKAIAANNSLALRRGAPVYGHAFTNGCVVANDSQRVFSHKFKILRNRTNNSARVNRAVLANPCTLHDCNVAGNACSRSDFHVSVNCHNGSMTTLGSILASGCMYANGCFILFIFDYLRHEFSLGNDFIANKSIALHIGTTSSQFSQE